MARRIGVAIYAEGFTLIRVGSGGSQHIVMSDGLTAPGGLTFKGHAAYVSNCGTCAGTGSVLRIPLS
jgi:hypothetical protein